MMSEKQSATDAENPADTTAKTAANGSKNLLSEHKGKLAIGVAATLGVMIFYGWRQRQLSKEDPEAYARLQRIKESVNKADETNAKPEGGEKPRKGAAVKHRSSTS